MVCLVQYLEMNSLVHVSNYILREANIRVYIINCINYGIVVLQAIMLLLESRLYTTFKIIR